METLLNDLGPDIGTAFDDPAISACRMTGGPAVSDLSCGALLRHAAAHYPQRIALKDAASVGTTATRSWTYPALLEEAEQGARALLTQFAPGERVALWATNSPEWIIIQFAAALADIVLVALNPANRERETFYALEQSRSVGLIYADRFRDVDAAAIVAAIVPDLPLLRVTVPVTEWPAFAATADDARPLPNVAADKPAMIQYTSGTTGHPKGAILPHRSIVNSAQFSALELRLEPGAVWYVAVPLFHTAGCVYGVLATVWRGGTIVVAPAFDPATMLQTIAMDRIAGATLVPTMVQRLLEAYEQAPDTDISSLDVIVGGGASVPPELVQRIERQLGCESVVVFGQTETGCAVSQTPRGATLHQRAETVGRVFPNQEVRIVDPQSGAPVPLGQDGEITLRGYSAFLGYFDMPEASAATLDQDGWMHTGDLGTLDADGFLTVTGRLKEVINRGGEKIYPREVEIALSEHPAVLESAVFGMADAEWGEVVAAAIRVADDLTDGDMLRAWLKTRIARHKVPQHIRIVSHFPVTPAGKVQKYVLQAETIAIMSAT